METNSHQRNILGKCTNMFRNLMGKIDSFSQKNKRNYYFLYFLAFALLFSAIAFVIFYYMFYMNGKTLVWIPDGQDQNLVTFIHFGEWGKSILDAFSSTGKLQVPLWDSTIAMGSDVVVTLNYYVFGDPLGLLAIVCPREAYEGFFSFLNVFRLFLAGVSFSVMCFYFKKSRFSTMVGATTYVFCGIMLEQGMRNPYFINPLYILPLLIIGVELIFKKKSPVLFIVTIALAAASNFYFFYYLTLMIFLYAIVRFIFLFKGEIKKNIVKVFAKCTIFYLIGIGLAAVLFIPSIMALLGNARVGAREGLSLLFPIDTYLSYFPNLVTGYRFSPLIFPCIAMLFMLKEPKHRILKVSFIVLIILDLFPVFGFIFNGFNYYTERWQFLLSLGYSFICVCMIPKLKNISKKQLGVIFAFLVVGVSISVIFSIGTYTTYFLFAIQGILLLFLLLRADKESGNRRFFKLAITIILVVGIIGQAEYQNSFLKGNYISSFMNVEDVEFYTREENFENKEPSWFYRVDTSERETHNDGLIQNFNSISGYFSTLSGVYFDFLMQTNAGGEKFSPSRFSGFDRRTALLSLASTNYFEIELSTKSAYVPYGYKFAKKVEKDGKKFKVYKNNNFLPLGYTYSSVINKGDFEDLRPEQKQEAMMRSIYLEEPLEGYESKKFDKDYVIDFKTEENENIEIVGNQVNVKRSNAKLKLLFDSKARSETYIQLDNLIDHMINPIDEAEFYLPEEAPFSRQREFEAKRRFSQRTKIMTVTVSTETVEDIKTLHNKDARFYSGIHDFTFNLGYNEESLTEAYLSFSKPGNYSLDNLNVISVPMEGYEERIASLNKDVLKDVKMTTNSISGKVDLKEDKILCLSIPYSEGFTAYVNGKETELLKANIMYSAIPLKAGKNKIELRYMTPYLKQSVLISFGTACLGIILLMLRFIWRRRKKKALVSE